MSHYNTSNQIIKKASPQNWPVIISIGIVVYLLGLFGIMMFSSQKLINNLKEKIIVTVFFSENAEKPMIDEILNLLKSQTMIKESKYISGDDAAFDYKKELNNDFEDILGYNPIPPSIEIFIKAKYADDVAMSNLEKKLMNYPYISEVYYEKNLIKEINANKKVFGSILLGLSVLFIVVAVFLINSTIRLHVYSQRFLIKSMQLVGATQSFIIKPFMKKSMKSAFWGICAALILLVITTYFLGTWINTLIFNGKMEWIDKNNTLSEIWIYSILFALLIIVGFLIVGICTFVSTKKYLNTRIEDLY